MLLLQINICLFFFLQIIVQSINNENRCWQILLSKLFSVVANSVLASFVRFSFVCERHAEEWRNLYSPKIHIAPGDVDSFSMQRIPVVPWKFSESTITFLLQILEIKHRFKMYLKLYKIKNLNLYFCSCINRSKTNDQNSTEKWCLRYLSR